LNYGTIINRGLSVKIITTMQKYNH